MIRVIPKRTKLATTLWKNYTIIDFIIVAIVFAMVLVAVSSNLASKWVIAITFLIIGAMLVVDWGGDEKGYAFFGNMIRFIALPKVYKKGVEKHSIDDLLPYVGILEDGFIEYLKGYFSKVLEIGQVEFSLLTEQQQDNRISTLEKVLLLLDDDERAELVKIDRPLNLDDFAKALFEKRKEEINDVKKRLLESRLNDIDVVNNIERLYYSNYYFVVYADEKTKLDTLAADIVDTLAQNKIPARVLDAKDIAVFLKYCHTRAFDEHEIDELELQDYIDWVKPEEVSLKGFGGIRKYKIKTSAMSESISASCLAIKDYPIEVANAWGAGLFNIDNTKVVMKFKPVASSDAIKRIDKAWREVATAPNVNRASEQLEQETHLDTMLTTLESVKNSNEAFFDVSILLTVFGTDCKEGDRRTNFASFKKHVKHSITSQGFKISDLLFRQTDGIIAQNVTKNNLLKSYDRGINSNSVAAVFPFVNTAIIEQDGFLLGWNNYPVILNPWKRDGSEYTNSNCVIIGRPGSGKSFCAKTILSNLYSQNCRFFVLDVENEYSTIAKAFGGEIIDIGNGTNGQRINPFHVYPILTEDGRSAEPSEIFSSKLRTLESFLKIILEGIDNDTLEVINNLIVATYKAKGIDENTDCSTLNASEYPTFDDLYKLIKQKINTEKNTTMLTTLERAETYIQKFAKGGRYASIWNGASTLSVKSDFVVFNFQSLLAGKNNVIANAQMLLVFNYIEQEIINIQKLNRQSGELIHPVLVTEEGYNFVDPKFPVALDTMSSMTKRLRKYAGMQLFITQNIRDFTATPETAQKTMSIINNSQYHFVFSLASGDLNDLAALYSGANELNDAELEMVAEAGQGECFFIASAKARTSFLVAANDTMQELFLRSEERRV